MTSKPLIIGGTHQRETEYSHGVVEMLLRHYNRSPLIPDRILESPDGTRKGKLYCVNDLALAMIEPTGVETPSSEYLASLPRDVLAGLAGHWFFQCDSKTPAYVPETNGFGQWTTLTTPMLEACGADVLIDLHSYHEATRGVEGRSLKIFADATRSVLGAMQDALYDAQTTKPELFGTVHYVNPKRQLGKRILDMFSKDELISIITAPPQELRRPDHPLMMIVDDHNRTRGEPGRRPDESWQMIIEAAPMREVSNYFCFEAVHWGTRQQEATVEFITQYFLPSLHRLWPADRD